MRKLGEIIRLQVQRDSIKSGTKPYQTYSPTPNLLSVHTLRLDGDGVEGIEHSGEALPDIHNATHPQSKFKGDNGLSLGFTGHYAKMRDRFGDHLSNGAAGENIIVEFDDQVSLEMIEKGVVIVGDQREVQVGPWVILNPCSPFTKFCLQVPGETKPDRTVTEALQFLKNGMRGFSAVYTEEASLVEIRVGDAVYAVD